MTVLGVLEKAYSADPEGTRVLVNLAMLDWMTDEVTKAGSVLDRVIWAAATEQVAKAKVALVRTYVAKASSGEYPEDGYARQAEYLRALDEYLSKASWESWNANAGKDKRRQVNRDERGRFMRVGGSKDVVDTNGTINRKELTGPAKSKTKVENGTVVHTNAQATPEDKKKVNEYQGSVEDARAQAQEVQRSLPKAERAGVKVKLRFAGDSIQDLVVPLEMLADEKQNGALGRQLPDSIDAKITGMTVFGAKDASDQAKSRLEYLNSSKMGPFARLASAISGNEALAAQGFVPRDGAGRLDTTMGRIGVAGQIMSAANPGSQSAQMAALVGAYGPEVMEAIGPHVKRGAYRYRGTERTPSATITNELTGDDAADLVELSRAIESGETTAVQAAKDIDKPFIARQSKPGAEVRVEQSKDNTPTLQSIRRRGTLYGENTGGALMLGVRSDVAALELLKTLPRKALIGELGRESTGGLPSQGIIIDRDGDVVSQSVGLANDHYLPFNLANMGRSRGGQYIRTRQEGGLTGEDIGAVIATGMRSATVASASGVFRLEMDPSFRGARGASDKAIAMQESYLRILETIQSSEMYTKPLDPDTMDEIHRSAMSVSNNDPKSAEYRDAFKAGVKEKQRESTRIEAKDRSAAKERAEQKFPDDPKAAEAFMDSELDRLQREKGSELNLNGEGYALALETLQQQFPYFIRSVEYTPLHGERTAERDPKTLAAMAQIGQFGFLSQMGALSSMARSSRGTDKGYVARGNEPWQNRSTPPVKAGTGSGSDSVESTAPAVAAKPTTPTAAADEVPDDTPKPAQPSADATSTQQKAKAALDEAKLDKAFGVFASEFANIASQAGINDLTIPGEDAGIAGVVAQASASQQVAWLFTQNKAKEMSGLFKTQPELAASILNASDSDLRAGLALGFSAKGVANKGESFEELVDLHKPFRQDTIDGFVAELRSQSSMLLDGALLAAGMAKPTNDKDQPFQQIVQAIGYPQIANLSKRSAMKDLLAEPKNAGLKTKAARLGVDPAKDDLIPLTDVRDQMKVLRDGYKELASLSKVIKANPSAAPSAADVLGKRLSPEFVTLTDIDEDTVDRALGTGGKTREPGLIRSEMEQWQQARTLIETARVWDMKKAGDDLFPKAGAALLPQIVKAHSFPRVLDAEDPVTVVVRKALAAGQSPPRMRRRSSSPPPSRS